VDKPTVRIDQWEVGFSLLHPVKQTSLWSLRLVLRFLHFFQLSNICVL